RGPCRSACRSPAGGSRGALAAARSRRRVQSDGAMSTEPIVRAKNVHKDFRRGSERIEVLQGVNLEIAKGEFLALMGPSGSGKTTLLNLIGGLDTPSGGSVEVAGVDISRMSGAALSRWRSQNIGFV